MHLLLMCMRMLMHLLLMCMCMLMHLLMLMVRARKIWRRDTCNCNRLSLRYMHHDAGSVRERLVYVRAVHCGESRVVCVGVAAGEGEVLRGA
jgi:hypothetical protein